MRKKTGSCKVFVTGGSRAITLPKDFADKHHLQKGDPLPYIISGTGDSIRFIPIDQSHPIMSGRAKRNHD